MTLVNIDLRNQGYETGPDDRVVFYSLLVREGDFGTISTAPVEVELTDGKASVDLAPGPVGVQIIAGQVADTRVKIGEVPPSGPTTLGAVMMVTPAYTPALQKMMIAAIERAKDTAVGQVDAEVAQAINAEVGEFKTKADQALTKSRAAESKSDAALSKSTTAESYADNAVSRVSALEAMSGLSPESPVDGQTANLVTQPDTLTRQAVDSLLPRRVEHPISYTVGAGGDYLSINSALKDLSTRLTQYEPMGLRVELKLLAGFVMEEQVFVENQNLGWITITAVDPVVTIRRSALVWVSGGRGDVSAFTGINNATLPNISVLFQMDESGVPARQNGCSLRFNSFVQFGPGAGVTHATNRGINVQQQSAAVLVGAIFSHSGNVGIRVANGSSVAGEESEAVECGDAGVSISSSRASLIRGIYSQNTVGVLISTGSSVAITGSDVSHCTQYGVWGREGSNVDFTDGIAQGCGTAVYSENEARVNAMRANVSESSIGFNAAHGASINAENGVANLCVQGVRANDGSTINFRTGKANFCSGISVQAVDVSTINCYYAQANDSGESAFYAVRGAAVNAAHASGERAVANGLRAESGSQINGSGGSFRRGVEDSSSDMVVLGGSQISATGATGGTFQTNTLSAAGIVYK